MVALSDLLSVAFVNPVGFALLFTVQKVDWDSWLFSPGMPPVENHYDTSLAVAADKLAVAWHTSDVMGIGGQPPPAATAEDMKGWPSAQVREGGSFTRFNLYVCQILSIACLGTGVVPSAVGGSSKLAWKSATGIWGQHFGRLVV